MSTFSEYYDIIEDELNRFGIFFNPTKMGIALHEVRYDKVSKTFSYSCVDADENFKKILSLSSIENIRYDEIFPQDKENKFDWSIVMGHSSEFFSMSKYYCYSDILKRWISFLVISPKKGYVLLVAEDITDKKINKTQNNSYEISIA